ncbi:reverse transcriptase domain-containing protein [Tanacetum coccineum]|uniref:Reverse transcriptase domain-containing protein n=1 Tax=Tanacetum coccineum TaxID=301880 RepID=A0ABQ5B8N3_9ASTR
MLPIRKRSSRKQNFSANHEGKHKSINGKRLVQAEQVRLGTFFGMIRGNTSRKRPREQSKQWLDNEISFASTPGCQLVDSPIILEALIEGFLVRRIYVDGGSSSEVIYEHCFRNLRSETRAKLKETRTPLVGFSGERETLHECRRMKEAQGPAIEGRITLPRIQASGFVGTTSQGKKEGRWKTDKAGELDDTIQPPPSPPKKDTQTDEKVKGKDEHLERPLESKPPSGLIKILRKHADDFTWTPAYMTGIPRFIAEHELKTYPQIEPRVQRKRSIALDRRKVVKDEVAEWLKAKIVRKDEEKTAFHTDEGVFCYKKMPFGLKNAGATYQRLVDTIFEGQMGRNLEAYKDDMVIKSKTEPEMIKDVEETLLILKKVNMKLNPKKCSIRMEEGKFLGYIVTSKGIRANPEKTKAVVNMPSPSNLKQMQRLSGKLVALNRFLSKAAEKALPCLDTLKKCTNKKDFHWRTEAEKAFQEMKKLITELPTLTAPKKEVELMVYLSTANEAVSAVLLVERHGRQAPIHYVSRTLQGAEINYPPMEKLVLALVHAARRLRRLAMWGIELEAYGIKYAPRSAIKGQVLADFLADTIAEDSSTQVKANRPNDTLTKGKKQ